MRGEVFRIFAAAVFVVVGNRIFEHRGEEIVFLVKHLLEIEGDKFVYQRFGKIVAFIDIGDIGGDGIEQGHVALAGGFDTVTVGIGLSQRHHRVVEGASEAVFRHTVIEGSYQKLGLHPRSFRHKILQVFAFRIRQCLVGVFPVLGIAQSVAVIRVGTFHFVAELVVQIFVQEHLHDDFVLAAVARQSVGGAGGAKGVNQRLSFLYMLFCVHNVLFF